MNTYTIKPLKWIESLDWEEKRQYKAETSRGYYRIIEKELMGDIVWFLEYSFCDYYDEGSGYLPDRSIETAKAYCERLWFQRMEADLDLTPTPDAATI